MKSHLAVPVLALSLLLPACSDSPDGDDELTGAAAQESPPKTYMTLGQMEDRLGDLAQGCPGDPQEGTPGRTALEQCALPDGGSITLTLYSDLPEAEVAARVEELREPFVGQPPQPDGSKMFDVLGSNWSVSGSTIGDAAEYSRQVAVRLGGRVLDPG